MDEPFSVALRLSLEVAESGVGAVEGPGWREQLRPISLRELGSRVWLGSLRPPPDEANRIVGETLTNHPLLNLTADKRSDLSKAPHALVIAEVVLRPELAPIPPGGAFPDVSDEVLSEPVPFHAVVWPHAVGSLDEREAAVELLQQIVGEISHELWLRDG